MTIYPPNIASQELWFRWCNSWHEFRIQVIRLGFFISFPGMFMFYRSTVFVIATNNYFWSKQVWRPWLSKASAPNKLNWSLVHVCERNSHLLQDQQELSLYLQLATQPRPGSQRPDMAAVWSTKFVQFGIKTWLGLVDAHVSFLPTTYNF